MHGFSVILVAFVTSVLSAAATVYVIERYELLHSAEEAALVPELRGLSESDARKNASAAGLSLLIAGREATPSARPGSVIQQSIPAGQRVPPQHPVSVTLAEELPALPKLVGLTLAEATLRLDQAGYRVQVGEPLADELVAEGQVAAQDPLAGAPHAKNSLVTLRVSSGPLSIVVPKLVGLPLNSAKAAVESAGLKVGTVRFVSIAETATYVVLNQKPLPGEKLRKGEEVELSVNR